MSTITVELTIKVKSKFISSNAERPNGFISPQMSEIFTTTTGSFRRRVVQRHKVQLPLQANLVRPPASSSWNVEVVGHTWNTNNIHIRPEQSINSQRRFLDPHTNQYHRSVVGARSSATTLNFAPLEVPWKLNKTKSYPKVFPLDTNANHSRQQATLQDALCRAWGNQKRHQRRPANLPARFAFRQQRKQRNNTKRVPPDTIGSSTCLRNMHKRIESLWPEQKSKLCNVWSLCAVPGRFLHQHLQQQGLDPSHHLRRYPSREAWRVLPRGGGARRWEGLEAPLEALLKPPWSPSQAPLKPPWSPSQAPFQASLKPSSPWSHLQALLKPPWSPFEALLKPP